jgi:hypothetical protein
MAKTDKEIVLTKFTSNKVLSKEFTFENGEIVKKAAAYMTNGQAEQLAMDMEEFAELLPTLKNDEALGFGIHDAEHYGERVVIRTKENAQLGQGILARTKEYLKFAQGPGMMMLDHDPSGEDAIDPVQLMASLMTICPQLKKVGYVTRGSVSAGVHKTGQKPSHSKGFHIYFGVERADDIPRIGAILFNRLWLEGLGYITISSAGTMLLRTYIDAAVFSPERLDFAGKPLIKSDGLEYTPPEVSYHPGQLLDTSQIKDLSEAEIAEVERLQTEAKRAVADEANDIRADWELAQRTKLEERGVTPDQIEAAMSRLGSGRSDLPPDWVLEFSDGRTATVREVLVKGSAFDDVTLADPIEGPAYGSEVAKFYWNDGHKPVVHSFAHGSKHVYFLKNTYGFDPSDFIFLKEDNVYFDVRDASLITKQVLNATHLSTNPGGKDKPPRAFDIFHKNQGQTVKGRYWNPTNPREPINNIIEVKGAKYLNTWSGINCEPEEGDIQPWLDLVGYLIPDQKERNIVIDWLAHIVQNPHIKPNWQIIHLGDKRNGKDSMYQPMMLILSASAGEVKHEDINGSFNGYMLGKKFLLFQEIYQPDNRQFVNDLKTIAADTAGGEMLINPKYGKQHMQANAVGFVAMSNHRAPMSIDENEGRYFCIASFIKPLEERFYQDYHVWLSGGGYRSIYGFLLNRDLSHFNCKVLPYKTPAFLAMVTEGLKDYERVINELINMREYPFNKDAVKMEDVREYLRMYDYKKCGLKGLAEAMRKAGWHLNEKNIIKVDGKVETRSNFWSSRELEMTPSERCRFFDEERSKR